MNLFSGKKKPVVQGRSNNDAPTIKRTKEVSDKTVEPVVKRTKLEKRKITNKPQRPTQVEEQAPTTPQSLSEKSQQVTRKARKVSKEAHEWGKSLQAEARGFRHGAGKGNEKPRSKKPVKRPVRHVSMTINQAEERLLSPKPNIQNRPNREISKVPSLLGDLLDAPTSILGRNKTNTPTRSKESDMAKTKRMFKEADQRDKAKQKEIKRSR